MLKDYPVLPYNAFTQASAKYLHRLDTVITAVVMVKAECVHCSQKLMIIDGIDILFNVLGM